MVNWENADEIRPLYYLEELLKEKRFQGAGKVSFRSASGDAEMPRAKSTLK